MISTLKKTVKKVTRKNNSWLQEEPFKLTSAQFSVENEFLRIDLIRENGDVYSITVFDKNLQKSVSLSFDFCDSNSVFVFVLNKKIRKLLNFFRKQYFCYELSEEKQNDDENIKFVWNRIPEYLFNL